MKASELCVGAVVTVKRGTTLQAAAEIMDEMSVGCVVVIDDQEPGRRAVGLVTDRDIVTKAVANNLCMSEETVETIMSASLVTVEESADVFEAARKMRDRKVRRVLVVDDQMNVTGLISTDDLVRALGKEMTGVGEIYECQSRLAQRSRAHDYTRMA